MSDSLLRRKIIVPDQPHGHGLARTLSWPHLVALGVGAIVGTGILTLIGVGADRAGPAVILSFVIAGLICACAALAYAEMSTMMPASGSAYRSEEHTSELQSLMRISYAVFCLKKKKINDITNSRSHTSNLDNHRSIIILPAFEPI